ncbi:outer membrane protein with beta-barrel domain [Flavobacterium chryseum]|uniref:porin family protein n=1 Tax=Flavobacterium sp. P3160 TaxID=2512113 RepID=UPI001060944A|nr:porin family protein [Flavobacterium sp. P3160]TDO69897.1 outer membrane protein with beta-barrel domain [Flavobacterium sp. P3160]
MKNFFLSAIAVMVFGFANAQQAKFGIKAGINLSNWTGDTHGVNIGSRFGVNMGGFAEININDRFAIQPEILYSTQGAKFKDFTTYVNGYQFKNDINWNLSYINIPVMFKYTADGQSFIEVGPQIGFLTSAKMSTKLTQYSKTVDQDAKDTFESIDFGLVLGVGYNITEHLATNLRYAIGLSNIIKTESGDDDKIHNSVFSLALGYKF